MRVRFAPSPTGFLHLGGLRTALFNYLQARKTNGTFIVRIEDTDQSRSVPGAVEKLLQDLNTFGLDFDEGPGKPNGTDYFQSNRLSVYRKYADHLLSKGLAYYCQCPKDQFCNCRLRPVNAEQPKTIRFSPQNIDSVEFEDENYGKIVNKEPVNNVVLIKSDGFPTYHFANVIDDHEMRVDLVMRGQEWLPSTPLHLKLYKAFDWSPPRFCHLPLLLNPDRTKLSKRDSASNVEWYLEQGFLPAAVLNFTSFLGWTPSVNFEGNREILSIEELVSVFSFKDLNRADAVVDIERLKWFNKQHMLIADSKDLMTILLKKMPGVDEQYAISVLEAMKGRISTIDELYENCDYFFKDPELSLDGQSFDHESLEYIAKFKSELDALECITEDHLTCLLGRLKSTDRQASRRNMLALRFAITGKLVGTSMSKTISLLGKCACLNRLARFELLLKKN